MHRRVMNFASPASQDAAGELLTKHGGNVEKAVVDVAVLASAKQGWTSAMGRFVVGCLPGGGCAVQLQALWVQVRPRVAARPPWPGCSAPARS